MPEQDSVGGSEELVSRKERKTFIVRRGESWPQRIKQGGIRLSVQAFSCQRLLLGVFCNRVELPDQP